MTKDKDYITLSEKHGVNPSILHCFICGKEIGLTLAGRLKDDAEAPKDIMLPGHFCDECEEHIKAKDKFFIEVKDSTDKDNPERTGRYVCVKTTALPDVKSPISYCEHTVFEKMFGEFIKE